MVEAAVVQSLRTCMQAPAHVTRRPGSPELVGCCAETSRLRGRGRGRHYRQGEVSSPALFAAPQALLADLTVPRAVVPLDCFCFCAAVLLHFTSPHSSVLRIQILASLPRDFTRAHLHHPPIPATEDCLPAPRPHAAISALTQPKTHLIRPANSTHASVRKRFYSHGCRRYRPSMP